MTLSRFPRSRGTYRQTPARAALARFSRRAKKSTASLLLAILWWLVSPVGAVSSEGPVSSKVSVERQGVVSPYLRLAAPRPIATGPSALRYQGSRDLVAAIANAEPRSLTAIDLDEDGVPDLVTGYRSRRAGLGLISVRRGSVDAIFPYTAAAKARKADGTFVDGPFLGPAQLAPVPETADFLSGGDFDGDGHFDVAAGAMGGEAIYLLSGDGSGRLDLSATIQLDGRLTAWTDGEINRRDNLVDLAVAIETATGPEALVFEHPNGALRAIPERFPLPASANDLLLGKLDGDHYRDLAVAAGESVVLIGGRDRRLTASPERRAAVPAAKLSRYGHSEVVLALAHGDLLLEEPGYELALLDRVGELSYLVADGPDESTLRSTALANSARDDVGSQRRKRRESGATWRLARSVSVESESSDQLSRVGARSVVRDGSRSSVRLAVARLASTGTETLLIHSPAASAIDLVTLAPPRSGEQPASSRDSRAKAGASLAQQEFRVGPVQAVLPMRLNSDGFADLVVTSHSGFVGVSMSSSGSTFVVNSTADASDLDTSDDACDAGSGGCTLRAAIEQANATLGADEIHFANALGRLVPASDYPAITESVSILGTSSGTDPIEILGSGSRTGTGLRLASGSSGSVVEGLHLGNFGTALEISSSGNRIEGNRLGNWSDSPFASEIGLRVVPDGAEPADNLIGGTIPAARNTFANFPTDIQSDSLDPAVTNSILGNTFGYIVGGEHFINEFSIRIQDSSGWNIGSAAGVNTGNLFANRLTVSGLSSDVVIQQNQFGTGLDGTEDVWTNHLGKISLAPFVSDVLVGSTSINGRNVIGGGAIGPGVRCLGATDVRIEGNLVGLKADGSLLRNEVGVEMSCSDSSIGGSASGAGNVIAGNTEAQVRVDGGSSITIDGNCIGTGTDCWSAGDPTPPASPAGVSGVEVGEGATVAVGLAASNVVAHNDVGIAVLDPTPGTTGGSAASGMQAFALAAIRQNLVHSNRRLGIDLGSPYSPTPDSNDLGDLDGGANRHQNYPVLDWVSVGPGVETTVQGSLHSTPQSLFQVEFFRSEDCDTSGFGEGQFFLGSLTVATDQNGDKAFSITFPEAVPAATPWITATASATVSSGETSEFSYCRRVENHSNGCTCPENVVIDYPLTSSSASSYSACTSILASSQVLAGAGVELAAPTIRLDPGFSVFSGATLRAGGLP